MLEKDIENLIAHYPDQFIKGYNLTLKQQQAQLGSYKADIIFEENNGTLLIVETKLGILTREKLMQATGQVIQYYGLLRNKEPNRQIKMMIAANIIPDGMTEFFTEKYGIQFLELPAHKLITFAQEVGYCFEKPTDYLTLSRKNQFIKRVDDIQSLAQERVWIFQANPKKYDILSALADDELHEDVWLVSRYQNQIHEGDLGLIWMSGKEEAGIYAVVRVKSNPKMLGDSEQSTKYWVDISDQNQVKRRVKIEYLLKLNPEDYIPKWIMQENSDLADLQIFRFSQGTNFKVTDEEWRVIRTYLPYGWVPYDSQEIKKR